MLTSMETMEADETTAGERFFRLLKNIEGIDRSLGRKPSYGKRERLLSNRKSILRKLGGQCPPVPPDR